MDDEQHNNACKKTDEKKSPLVPPMYRGTVSTKKDKDEDPYGDFFSNFKTMKK